MTENPLVTCPQCGSRHWMYAPMPEGVSYARCQDCNHMWFVRFHSIFDWFKNLPPSGETGDDS